MFATQQCFRQAVAASLKAKIFFFFELAAERCTKDRWLEIDIACRYERARLQIFQMPIKRGKAYSDKAIFALYNIYHPSRTKQQNY